MGTEEQKDEKPHKRRVRYSGTHPRKFSEKYKELNPEKYQDTIERVISKGSTPAGMHISICVQEILTFLQIKPGMKGLDATLGYGGHSRKMLEALQGRVAEQYGPFDFLLADLGVSSMQIDNPERGFSYKQEGPLDLRLNPQNGEPASERLQKMNREEIEGMLIDNSDEPYAAEIARAIAGRNRKGQKIDTTTKLAELIGETLAFLPEKERKEAVKKSCARVFQALRIDVNSEFEVLEAFLTKLPSCMAPGGRIAILTFHSGEDRLVKHAFKEGKKAGIYSEVAEDVIRPSSEECAKNPRAKSTKMRWAVLAEE